MKLRALYNEAGVIVAAVAIDGVENEIVPEPLPGPGETLVDLDVPGEYREEDLVALCTSHRVDAAQTRLVPFGGSDATG